MGTSQESILSSLFGDYRAEWPCDKFGSLFIQPSYFSKLIAKRPCLLIGGRGTGKTTSLKSLRFDAAASITGGAAGHTHPEYLGIYVRINKNRVRAFQGSELDEKEWDQAFVHYFNLLACHELCLLAEWVERSPRSSRHSLRSDALTESLGLADNPQTVAELKDALDRAVVKLELFVNNPRSVARPVLSMSEAPLRYFVSALRDGGYLEGRTVFCCLDEYENLTSQQQSIINTYVKHSEPPLTYKIGLRRNGLRTRATIDEDDQISTPDDYSEIDISLEDFETFALAVAQLRLDKAREQGVPVPETPRDFLPPMPFQEEARRLGADRIARKIRDQLSAPGVRSDLKQWLESKPDEELYFIGYWIAGHGGDPVTHANEWMANPSSWSTRMQNYGYASLFWLSRGRKGARVRKYYCGIDTFVRLASGNIRYFLELVDESIHGALKSEGSSDAECIVIDGLSQTDAARNVGRRRLAQIESLSEHGVDLKRFVLAIGKVFFEFARDPRKAPETDVFVLSGTAEARAEVETILQDGVGHLAFEAIPRTKATTPSEVKDDEYRVHPIFAAFFEYSHRLKRRATFDAADLLLLRAKPALAMRKLLGGVEPAEADELPTQLQLFSPFFEGGDE